MRGKQVTTLSTITSNTSESAVNSNTGEESSGGAVRLPKELRRRQLISSARTVFISQGYHVTTMNHIAAAAEVTKPVLYQHFKSKRELYLAVMDQQIKELIDSIVAPLHEAEENRAKVEGALGAFFDFARNNPQGYRLIFESDIHSDSAVQQRLEAIHTTIAKNIALILGPNAELDAESAGVLSRTLTGMALSAAEHAVQHGAGPDKLRRVEYLLFRLAWGGISMIAEDWD